MSELEQRVEKLELQNRKLQCGLGALVALLVAVPLLGAAMPQETAEMVTARTVLLVDEKGDTRVYLGENGIAYYDENGVERLGVVDTGVYTSDANGMTRAMMSARGFDYRDETATVRARLGEVELPRPATDASTIYPAAVVLYDAEGNVVWQAPR